MHVRELVEVAGIVALHGPLLVEAGRPPSVTCLEEYWSASKCRFENWNRSLKAYALLQRQDSFDERDDRQAARATLDEVFVSELLTRVWTAVLVACDRNGGSQAVEPVARNILDSHLEVRHRALELLVEGSLFSPHQLVALNRLRRRVERWSDVLVGGLIQLGDVTEFAVHRERAADFGEDLLWRRQQAGGHQAWRLTVVSLRSAFHLGMSDITANADANARIAASILGCFPDESFDSTGQFQSLWMMRLAANTCDAQGMIEDLLRSTPTRAALPTAIERRRRI